MHAFSKINGHENSGKFVMRPYRRKGLCHTPFLNGEEQVQRKVSFRQTACGGKTKRGPQQFAAYDAKACCWPAVCRCIRTPGFCSRTKLEQKRHKLDLLIVLKIAVGSL